jgi:hypothetical protein
MPFMATPREWIARSLSASRGTPEVAWPLQRLSKVQQDALIDRTSLTTLPPQLLPPRLLQEIKDIEIGPAAKIPTLRGEDVRFMTLPGHDGVAENILRYTDEKAASYFARHSQAVQPARTASKQQQMVDGFLRCWTGAFKQEWALIQQYIEERDWQRITGHPKPKWTPREISGSFDLFLTMDVRDLDMDYVLKKLEAVSKFILPEDAAGVIDRAKLVRMKLRAIDPRLEEELVVSLTEASQKLFRDVEAEFMSMFLGNPPKYVENDPTADQQLRFATQIVSANPIYQQHLGLPNSRFSQAVESWSANRMQSVRQEQNKTVGRIGTQPLET